MRHNEVKNDKLFESLSKKLKEVPIESFEYCTDHAGMYLTNIGGFQVSATRWRKRLKGLAFVKDYYYGIEYREGTSGDWNVLKNTEAKELYEFIEKKYNEGKDTQEDRLMRVLEDVKKGD